MNNMSVIIAALCLVCVCRIEATTTAAEATTAPVEDTTTEADATTAQPLMWYATLTVKGAWHSDATDKTSDLYEVLTLATTVIVDMSYLLDMDYIGSSVVKINKSGANANVVLMLTYAADSGYTKADVQTDMDALVQTGAAAVDGAVVGAAVTTDEPKTSSATANVACLLLSASMLVLRQA